jgi:hypothetical protein
MPVFVRQRGEAATGALAQIGMLLVVLEGVRLSMCITEGCGRHRK